MDIFREILGPKSKYDKSLPYTYEARVDILHVETGEQIHDYYYADTLCGLVEYLDENLIDPEDTELYEIYQNGEKKIINSYCLDKNGRWLSRPQICASLRGNYVGHIDQHSCSYQDRDRQGDGPF